MAGVLACGPGSLLSHRSCGRLRGILSVGEGPVDVTVPGQRGRDRPGLRVHRADTLLAEDAASHLGIPCTSVERTLLDLAARSDPGELERIVDRAESLRILDLPRVRARALLHHPRPGSASLLAVLPGDPVPVRTRSDLERGFLRICTRAGVPRPKVNAWMDLRPGFEVDFLWEEAKLVVETDGRATHGTARAFERDRERDRRLLLAGYRVARFTYRQVFDSPQDVAGTIRALLS